MICDLCGKNPATVHLTQVINDQRQELHLCQPCAKEKGVEPSPEFPENLFEAGLPELLAGLADLGVSAAGGEKKSQATCSGCGMSYEDFRKSGRLGCGHCYQSFEQYLAPLLKRIHGTARHVGKTPVASLPKRATGKTHLSQLKERLKTAVAGEDFEEAARLRDQIRTLESKSKKKP